MTRAAALTCLLLPLSLGCQPWEPRLRTSPRPLPPVALDSRLAFVEQNNHRAFLVEVTDPDRPARLVPLPPNPVSAARRPGHDQLLVLARGERGGPAQPPVPPALTLIPSDPAQAPTAIPLISRFDTLAQSPDGHFAIAHFGPVASGGETLFNPNELALVDLQTTPPRVVPRTLRSYGSVPRQVVFSPTLALPDGPRTLALVLSDNFVTVLDLDHPERSEITVALTLPEDRRTLRPVQVLFQATADPAIYLRVEGVNDIYALRLTAVPAAERAPNGNDFRPAMSQLAAGTNPQDMALFEASNGAGPRLLVVSPASHDAWLIDARTSRTTRIPLDADANRIALFDGTTPDDPRRRPRALLLGTNLDARAVSFLDLDDLDVLGPRNLDSRPMNAPVQELLLLADRGLALVRHAPNAGQIGVSAIDLARRTVAPLFAEVPLAAVVRAPAPSTSDKLWVGATQGERLAFLTLPALAPGEVRLDAPVSAVYPLTTSPDGHNRVVVLHPDPAGAFTVLDADQPDRATARSGYGFLLQDLLEREDR